MEAMEFRCCFSLFISCDVLVTCVCFAHCTLLVALLIKFSHSKKKNLYFGPIQHEYDI
jgi:hypothetical protein